MSVAFFAKVAADEAAIAPRALERLSDLRYRKNSTISSSTLLGGELALHSEVELSSGLHSGGMDVLFFCHHQNSLDKEAL